MVHGENGWTFAQGEGVIPDPLFEAQYLYQIYIQADPNYTGRVTVPVLWDKKTHTIVNNESSEIIRMFNSAFDDIGAKAVDYYPSHLREEIDEVNDRIYHNINNGVYKCGFATTQQAYEEAFIPLFSTLDWLEERLSKQKYLVGNQLTEAD
ncbi:glutathione S-transferase C-terminal domain-containing protein [Cyanobacterium aponinum]|uniref:glutathione S-transferase C-terminal domain-containing protein n=1 Tax=Cyanobacterium aponinum TaxID=379064 RepID=UPI0002E81986|nr:glutathione S-transferase C-terminal domain-containing protein [Cyanobacterium aponinum]